jgi:hypothetical protein
MMTSGGETQNASFPGQQIWERLEARTQGRTYGFGGRLYERLGLEDPWSSAPEAAPSGRWDDLEFLSSRPFYAMLRRLAQSRWWREYRAESAALRAASRLPGQGPKHFNPFGVAALSGGDFVFPEPIRVGAEEAPAEEGPPRISAWTGARVNARQAAWHVSSVKGTARVFRAADLAGRDLRAAELVSAAGRADEAQLRSAVAAWRARPAAAPRSTQSADARTTQSAAARPSQSAAARPSQSAAPGGTGPSLRSAVPYQERGVRARGLQRARDAALLTTLAPLEQAGPVGTAPLARSRSPFLSAIAAPAGAPLRPGPVGSRAVISRAVAADAASIGAVPTAAVPSAAVPSAAGAAALLGGAGATPVAPAAAPPGRAAPTVAGAQVSPTSDAPGASPTPASSGRRAAGLRAADRAPGDASLDLEGGLPRSARLAALVRGALPTVREALSPDAGRAAVAMRWEGPLAPELRRRRLQIVSPSLSWIVRGEPQQELAAEPVRATPSAWYSRAVSTERPGAPGRQASGPRSVAAGGPPAASAAARAVSAAGAPAASASAGARGAAGPVATPSAGATPAGASTAGSSALPAGPAARPAPILAARERLVAPAAAAARLLERELPLSARASVAGPLSALRAGDGRRWQGPLAPQQTLPTHQGVTAGPAEPTSPAPRPSSAPAPERSRGAAEAAAGAPQPSAGAAAPVSARVAERAAGLAAAHTAARAAVRTPGRAGAASPTRSVEREILERVVRVSVPAQAAPDRIERLVQGLAPRAVSTAGAGGDAARAAAPRRMVWVSPQEVLLIPEGVDTPAEASSRPVSGWAPRAANEHPARPVSRAAAAALGARGEPGVAPRPTSATVSSVLRGGAAASAAPSARGAVNRAGASEGARDPAAASSVRDPRARDTDPRTGARAAGQPLASERTVLPGEPQQGDAGREAVSPAERAAARERATAAGDVVQRAAERDSATSARGDAAPGSEAGRGAALPARDTDAPVPDRAAGARPSWLSRLAPSGAFLVPGAAPVGVAAEPARGFAPLGHTASQVWHSGPWQSPSASAPGSQSAARLQPAAGAPARGLPAGRSAGGPVAGGAVAGGPVADGPVAGAAARTAPAPASGARPVTAAATRAAAQRPVGPWRGPLVAGGEVLLAPTALPAGVPVSAASPLARQGATLNPSLAAPLAAAGVTAQGLPAAGFASVGAAPVRAAAGVPAGTAARPMASLAASLAAVRGDVSAQQVDARLPSWAKAVTEGAGRPAPGDLVTALTRASSPEEIVRVILDRAGAGPLAQASPSELPEPVAEVLRQVQGEVSRVARVASRASGSAGQTAQAVARPARPRASAGAHSRSEALRNTDSTVQVTRAAAGSKTRASARVISGWTGLARGVSAPAKAPARGVAPDRVMQLANKLKRLIHLAEGQRLAEARRQARLSAEGTGPEEGGSVNGEGSEGSESVDIEALSREVLAAVMQELELRRVRRQEDSDVGLWW